jgi:hypothetical protein
MKWEYANLEWEDVKRGGHRAVRFTHRDPWLRLPAGDADFYAVMRALGDDGWEMVAQIRPSRTASHNTWWFKRPQSEEH